MNFRKYQHIERFGTDEVDNIEIGRCFIFPKVDGTNSSIWYEDGGLRTGSRNRELTLEKDNAGFYAWVIEHREKFMPFFEEHPNYRIYGEWLVKHTIKTYRDTAWRNLYIFDVAVDSGEGVEYLPYEVYQPMLEKYGLEYITPQKIITNPTYEQLSKELEENHYLMGNNDDIGEGIVIKNYDFYNKYHRQTWAKIVRAEFKEKHRKLMGTAEVITELLEEKIVEKYVTTALVEKEKSKIENECGGWKSQYIARLLSSVFYSLITEDAWHFIKENKLPKIDFKTLNALTTKQIKIKCPEIFS